MAPATTNVYSLITQTIKKFKFEELETLVLPHFPETRWDRIRARLIRHHDNFTSTNVSRIIEQTLVKHNISDEEAKERLTLLEVIEVSRHSTRKNWYGFELLDKRAGPLHFPLGNLRRNIIQILHTFKIDMKVQLVTHNGMIFISMRNKKSIHLMPIFFTLLLEQGYFFSSRKINKKEFLHAITESTGYNNFKKIKLNGKHLESLVKMLQMKKQGATHADKICKEPIFKEAPPRVRPTGTDFRQHKQRREFIEQIFGPEQPTIDILVVKNPGMPWVDQQIKSLCPNDRINMEWEFRSNDILNFLGELAERRVLLNPLPNYVTKLLERGKNELKIKSV